MTDMAETEMKAGEQNGEGLGTPDAAQRSLSDALRVSFALLRLLILVLVAVFLLSGTFRVKTGEVAVRLQFGKLVEHSEGDDFYAPGGPYFAWPEPIDRVIRVPVTSQELTISNSFWFNIKEEDIGKPLDEMPVTNELDPELDGFLVTADQNIMHGRWIIRWQVNEDEAGDFIRTVSASSTPKQMLKDAEVMLRYVAEQAIVATLAQHTADQFRLGQIIWDGTCNRIQSALRKMRTGILVTSVAQADATPPLAVRAAFLQVDQAQSGRNQSITAAETARARVLGKAAGEASGIILSAVAYYERLLRRGDSERAELVHKALGQFYNAQSAEDCFKTIAESESDPEARKQLENWLKPVKVSGEAFDTIQKAKASANDIRETVSKEAEAFLNRLTQHRKNPRVLRDRLWQETLNQIFAGNAERFYLPPGEKEVYIEINRDPAIKKRLEREAYEAKEKKAREK